MANEKAYQTVIAGRVREDEAIGFFGDNKIAVPGRTFVSVPTGGKTQPTIELIPLFHENVGKVGDRSDALITHLPNSYNAGL